MALTEVQIKLVENTIRKSLFKKLEKYNPEPAVMPFHTRLLGKDRLALYAFIHSLNTNFGITIFEPVAVLLASERFKVAKYQVKSGSQIGVQAQVKIQNIMDELTAANQRPDKLKEIEDIRKVCQKGGMKIVKPTKVDVYLEDNEGVIYLIDIKKLNKSHSLTSYGVINLESPTKIKLIESRSGVSREFSNLEDLLKGGL